MHMIVRLHMRMTQSMLKALKLFLECKFKKVKKDKSLQRSRKENLKKNRLQHQDLIKAQLWENYNL